MILRIINLLIQMLEKSEYYDHIPDEIFSHSEIYYKLFDHAFKGQTFSRTGQACSATSHETEVISFFSSHFHKSIYKESIQSHKRKVIATASGLLGILSFPLVLLINSNKITEYYLNILKCYE